MAIQAYPYVESGFQPRSNTEKSLDKGFIWLTRILALGVAVLLLVIASTVAIRELPAIQEYGLGFLFSSEWNPVEGLGKYGALPIIYGTLVSSAIALVLAIPLGVGTAVFLSENFLPLSLRTTLVFMVALLAAIPGIVYGLWGIFVLAPAIAPILEWLHQTLGWIPLFSTVPGNRSM